MLAVNRRFREIPHRFLKRSLVDVRDALTSFDTLVRSVVAVVASDREADWPDEICNHWRLPLSRRTGFSMGHTH